MSTLDDHLCSLGVERTVSIKELKKAYRQQIQRWHPDHFHDDPIKEKQATQRAVEINAAFEYLSEMLELGPLPGGPSCTNSDCTSSNHRAYTTQHTYNRKPYSPGFPDPRVVEVFVKSSHIVSTGYDRPSGTMYIKFEGSRVYSYRNVPEAVFAEFIDADSPGKFAHRHIYGRYEYAVC